VHLDKEDVNLFFKLWYTLAHSVNDKHKIVPPFKRPVYGDRTNGEQFMAIREELWKHPKWIDEFIKGDGAHFTDEEKTILRSWRKHFVYDKFVAMKHLKKHSVLLPMSEKSKLYGVIGISEEFEMTMQYNPLPYIIETALLPFKGRIVYDSLLMTYNILIGPGFSESLKKTYNETKKACGIIETLS
jgi:hypothetical protein